MYGALCQVKKLNQPILHRCDIVNQIREGGAWIVISGNVYDVTNFECENASTVELIRKLKGSDATSALSVPPHAAFLSRVTEKFVGIFADQIYTHSCNVSIVELSSF